jgi:hypothetical protein
MRFDELKPGQILNVAWDPTIVLEKSSNQVTFLLFTHRKKHANVYKTDNGEWNRNLAGVSEEMHALELNSIIQYIFEYELKYEI